MKERPKISILICTNKAPAVTDDLLATMTEQKLIECCEVIFVDNGIMPERAKTVKKKLGSLSCPVKYVYEKTPGIWAARKTSYENAVGEWALILDDDNFLGQGAIEALYNFIARNSDVGGICPRVIAEWEIEPPEWLQKFGLACLSYNESGHYKPQITETVWLPGQEGSFGPPGGGMIVRRDVIDAFLEYYINYPQSLRCSRLAIEDLALWFFVDRLNLKTAYVPSISVFHRLPETRTKIKYLNWLNFRMVFAYSQLVNFERKDKGIGAVLKSTFMFAKSSFFMKPNNAAAMWLKTVRIAGYTAGLLKVKLS